MKQTPFEYDFIIVGQGIVGSMLTHFLLQQQQKIIVIDQFNPNSSSNIAAGVVNPITGRKMVKSWIIDEVLPFAKSTYKDLETSLNTRFFYEQEIYKLFSSNDDIKIWNQKRNETEYENYLGEIINDIDANISSPFGIGIIKQGCWLDAPVFVNAYRNFLKQNDALLEETLNTDDLIISEKIQYKNITAKKIIFCEGYQAYKNPYFNFIEFSLAKGEQFVIHSPNLQCDKILNKNIFIIPKKNNQFTIGSTFVWNDLTEKVTDDGRNEILDKLNKVLKCDFEIIEEKAGIRPTIKDRRPVIGMHHKYSNMYIFNGFGTKGVSLSPFLAHHFTNHLINNVDILKEVKLSRFFKFSNNH